MTVFRICGTIAEPIHVEYCSELEAKVRIVAQGRNWSETEPVFTVCAVVLRLVGVQIRLTS